MSTGYRSSNMPSAPSSANRSFNASFPTKPSSFYVFQPRPAAPSSFRENAGEFDGKRLRKAVARKTVDYNSSVVKMLESRLWQRDYRDSRVIQPDIGYYTQMVPPMQIQDNPTNCITTKFVRTSTNKMRCPIFCVLWTPEGRRLVTGASSGEFTLWNGLTFNFETILQAHDSAVKVMVWSRNDSWMVTADQTGYVKYWQSNMNNVKMFQAHKEPVRAISFCPTDTKFATCSDDGTVRIWDFLRCHEERILRGHGADVKGVDWHPTKALIASGSKDSQQPVKLWDPKTGQSLATLHAHKNTVTDVKWNQNGNWLLTSSRDHLIKIFDIRNMSSEMQAFRGHKKEVSCLSWHPVHEGLFASGGSDGSINFWLVGTEREIGAMEQAHDSIVWSLSWHPLGHILTSGSNDHSCKFWTRNRPGDKMRDKYNLNLLPKDSDEVEYEEELSSLAIPGMGFADRNGLEEEELPSSIPGFGFDRVEEEASSEQNSHRNYNHLGRERKVPYSKPIPKQFQQQWNSESKLPNSSRNDRRNEAHYSQGFDNSPKHDRFQPPNQQPPQFNNTSNHDLYSATPFQPPPLQQQQPPQPPSQYFNGTEPPPPPFGCNNQAPPNFGEFNQNAPPSPNFGSNGSNPIPPSFFSTVNQNNNSTEQYQHPAPFPNQPPPSFANSNHFPSQQPYQQTTSHPTNQYNQQPGYLNENLDLQSYDQLNYPMSKRVRS